MLGHSEDLGVCPHRVIHVTANHQRTSSNRWGEQLIEWWPAAHYDKNVRITLAEVMLITAALAL